MFFACVSDNVSVENTFPGKSHGAKVAFKFPTAVRFRLISMFRWMFFLAGKFPSRGWMVYLFVDPHLIVQSKILATLIAGMVLFAVFISGFSESTAAESSNPMTLSFVIIQPELKIYRWCASPGLELTRSYLYNYVKMPYMWPRYNSWSDGVYQVDTLGPT